MNTKSIVPLISIVTIAMAGLGHHLMQHETASATEVESGWQLVLSHDSEGNALNGNLQNLIEDVRKGHPVRIGFGEVESSTLLTLAS